MSSVSGSPLSPIPPTVCRGWWKDCLIVAVLATLWCCGLLGIRPLANPDEGRYTEIPREMAASGDYVTPRLNGVKYFEKPPLLYWLNAVTFKVAGINEFTTRLWNALFGVLGIVLTYAAGRALYGRPSGIAAAIVLATTLLYHALGQILLLDMAVAVAMSGALFAFIVAMREPRGRRRFLLFLAFYLFIALAVLSKGLIGLLLPGAIIFLWVLLLGRWKTLWPFYPLAGSLIILLLTTPWHYLAAKANADFLHFYFIHEHFERFTTRVHGRYEPWWYFLPVLFVGLFPWVAFAGTSLRKSLAGGWKARHRNAEAWFLLIWIVFVVVFFSKSQSKLIPYILPVFPAAAILIGRQISDFWQNRSERSIGPAAWIFIGLTVVLALTAILAPAPRRHPELTASLSFWRDIAAVIFAGGAIVVFTGLRQQSRRWVISGVTATSIALLLCLNFIARDLDKTSTKVFCEILQSRLRPEDRIYHLRLYAQDMPAYLGRLVNVVDYEGELSFGIHAEPESTSPRFLLSPAFFDQWCAPGMAYAVMRKRDYENWFADSKRPHQFLWEDNGLVLIANRQTDF